MPSNSIVVTGGAGFIGSQLIRKILSDTDFNVINIDKLTYAGNLDSLKGVIENPKYTFFQVDICDKDSIKKIFQEHKPRLIMHLAAESHVDRSIVGASDFIQTNIFGTFNLLEISKDYYETLNKEQKNIFRFHHISTDEVYGDLSNQNDFFNESTSYNPSSPYSASKASSDHLVRAWRRTYGLPVIITNCSNNYGPFHHPEKLIPLAIINAIRGKKIPIYGNGQQIRDWLYVEDHADALLRVAFDGLLGETYNIGGKNEKQNIEVVESVCKILDDETISKPGNINSYVDLIKYVDDRPGHDLRYAIDPTKIENQLAWRPKETFKSGLQKTVKWYIENEWWWQPLINNKTKNER